jgi:hypothetical protein
LEEDVKDQALRHSLLIVAKAHLTRGDVVGDSVHKLLMSILDGAETMDKVLAMDTPKRKRNTQARGQRA